MALQNLRTSVAHKRPIPTLLSAGQIAVNTNEASPALFFKDSNGDLVKVGPVHIGTDAPNSSPAATAATALVTGATYQILTVGTSDFTLVGASANTVGTIFTATGTTTGDGTVSGQQGVEKGEMWLDTTGGNYVLKIYDGTAWRSEAGEFVNVTGDTMTGALLLDNAASASAPDLSFDGDANTGLYSPGADQVALATNGTQRVVVDSSGNVGVGTTSPTVLLDLESTSPTIKLTDSDASGTPECQISGAGGDLVLEADRDNEKSDSLIRLAIDGTERLRIDSSGNVGIGTTSPSTVLHTSVAADNELRVQSTGSGGAGNTRLRLQSATASTAYDWYLQGDAGGSLRFYDAVAGTDRLRIDSSGNVGVGTSSPNSVLHIEAPEGAAQLTIGNTALAATDGDFLAGIDFHIKDNNDGTGAVCTSIRSIADQNHTLIAKGTALAFSTTPDDTTTLTERLRIDQAGNVGIGTTSPSTRLDLLVSPASGGADGLKVSDGTRNCFLHITGSAYSYNGVGASETLLYGGGNPLTLLADGQPIKFCTGSSEKARLDTSGRLLVGTSTVTAIPAALNVIGGNNTVMHTQGANADSPFLFLSHARGTGTQSVNAQDGVGAVAFVGYDGTNALTAARIEAFVDGTPGSNDMPGRLVFSTTADGASSPTERMRIDNAGNVLVGKTSTSNSVNGLNIAPNGVTYTSIPSSNNTYHVYSTTSGSLTFYVNANGGVYNVQANNVNISDERVKKNIENLDSTWTCLKNWELKKFHYAQDSDTDDKKYGVIAQQIAPHCPEVIADWIAKPATNAILDEDGNVVTAATEEVVHMGVKEGQMMWMAIKALQEAQTRIETLEAKVAALEAS